VEAVVEEKFRASGIRITGKGEMTAEQIDANMYIDTHYGAIANKAVKLQPKELNVPEKGKIEFEKLFGESWDAAVAAGNVYNAKDAATKLGLDAAGINTKWSALKPGTNLIKFGGGFYCGKFQDENIYVMNGFYMSMRAGTYYVNGGSSSSSTTTTTTTNSVRNGWDWFCLILCSCRRFSRYSTSLHLIPIKIPTVIQWLAFWVSWSFFFLHFSLSNSNSNYLSWFFLPILYVILAYCNPGEKIQWYTVSWPADSLSWQDFRGQVLGATNPSSAPVGSIRRTILDKYKELGLTTKPNTGDNGVHASASPFEALAERMNWLGVEMEQDLFGKGLLAKKNVSKSTILTWAGDAQVSVKDETTKPGQTMSVFDTLEDLDADTILEKVDTISK
jgi:hypothetical protein